MTPKPPAIRSSTRSGQSSQGANGASGTRKVHQLAPALLAWYAQSARDLPWRRTRDPYAIWVSEIMLQQTQVATVIAYYERWMKALPTIQSLARVSSSRLHKLWEGLGYYTRVRNLQKAARLICQAHHGRFPTQFEDILALPGIGRYTAGAICSIAFDQPTPILDGNVIRVLTRVFGITADPKERQTNERLWQLANALVRHASRFTPHATSHAPTCSHLNQSLMELGATVCTPRKPDCPACPARTQCSARRQGFTAEIPAARSRPKTIQRRVQAFVVQHGNRFLALQQPKGSVNSGLWEFPSIDVKGVGLATGRITPRIAGILIRNPELLCTIRHSITRYRITVNAYLARPARLPRNAGDGGRWLTLRELERLPFSAAHRRIARTLHAQERKHTPQESQ